MMRHAVFIVVTLSLLAASPLQAGPQDLPRHPREIRFPQQSLKLPVAEDHRYQLESGPVVYIFEDHTLPLVDIALAVRAGSFLDPPYRTGLASLVATQLRRGGTATLDPDQFDERVDELGARLDSSAGATRAGATLSAPTWSLGGASDLFFEMIKFPKFDSTRLENARQNLLESLTRRNENALDIVQREWGWLLFGAEHFMTRPWTPDTLETISSESMVDFHRRYWRPESMILAISGDIQAKTLLPELEKRFSDWPPREASAHESWPPSQPARGADPGLYQYESEVPQTKIIMGHRLTKWIDWLDKDRFALELVAEILGGRGGISRIAGRLRTAEGLVYRVSLGLNPGEFWPGQLEIFFETKNSSVATAVDLATREIQRLREQPPHPDELRVAKQSIEARLGSNFDTAEKIAGYFAQDDLVDRPHSYWQAAMDGIDQISAIGVRDAAQTYLDPNRMICLVVGPWSEISGSKNDRGANLEQVVGHPVVHLPERDPLTLQPVGLRPAETP